VIILYVPPLSVTFSRSFCMGSINRCLYLNILLLLILSWINMLDQIQYFFSIFTSTVAFCGNTFPLDIVIYRANYTILQSQYTDQLLLNIETVDPLTVQSITVIQTPCLNRYFVIVYKEFESRAMMETIRFSFSKRESHFHVIDSDLVIHLLA
jgi:hypothetical protein